MTSFANARALLSEFKGEGYISGMGVLSQVGHATAQLGRRSVLIADTFPGSDAHLQTIKQSLSLAGVQIAAETGGARANAPLEDLARMTTVLAEYQPDVIISFGGGSTIDAAKAAEVLRSLGGEIEDYFGTGLVSQAMKASGRQLTPHVAIQTAASSGAHLTKYANITNLDTSQKKLIVDDAIVPLQPVFDYEVSFGAHESLKADGALDGVAHCLEVLYGAVGKPYYTQMERVADVGIRLVVEYLPRVLAEPQDRVGREALGLATDLGAYAIMLGGTNGGHLTSFSLVDILSHGRACAIMNPYYTVYFAPAIQAPLQLVGQVYVDSGDLTADTEQAQGREWDTAPPPVILR